MFLEVPNLLLVPLYLILVLLDKFLVLLDFIFNVPLEHLNLLSLQLAEVLFLPSRLHLAKGTASFTDAATGAATLPRATAPFAGL